MNSRTTIFIAFFMVALMPDTGIAQTVPSSPVAVQGFKALDVPQSDLRIGADWVDGVGPIGAVPKDITVITRTGVSSYVMEKNLKKGLSASFLKYLGLKSDVARKVDTSFTGLQIVGVNALPAESIKPGRSILFEGLKAGKIIIKFNKENEGSVRASLADKGLPVNASASMTSKNTLAISGENLFIAYRVIEISAETPITAKVNFKFTAADEGIVKIAGYDFDLPVGEIANYRCGSDAGAIKIEVENYSILDAAGKPFQKAVNHTLGEVTKVVKMDLGEQINTGLVTRDFARISIDDGTLLVRDAMVRVPGITCYEVRGQISVTTSRLAMKSIANPSAPGM